MGLGSEYVHVVIGILFDTDKNLLVSKRKEGTHLEGLLEFPGGKVKNLESAHDALKRELQEELNIEVQQARPLIQIPYSYPDRNILLDVYIVEQYSGEPEAIEKQELRFCSLHALNKNEFPKADHGIFQALRLPGLYTITPDYSDHAKNFKEKFKYLVSNPTISMIQLRSHSLKSSEYIELSEYCKKICKQCEKKLIVNCDVDDFVQTCADGLHLTSQRLLNCRSRTEGDDFIIGASCHNKEEILHACYIGLDYIILGPVLEKYGHASVSVLTWSKFAELAKLSSIPVYAVGGLSFEHINECIQLGGQGIASIRSQWPL